MKNKIILWMIAVSFFGCSISNAQNKVSESFAEQLSKAKLGSVESQKNIGAYYYFGYDGIEQNYKQSFAWFEKAAIADNQQAQEMLAYMYSIGQYVKKDDKLALQWQKKAIETKTRYDSYISNCIKFRESELCEEQWKKLPSWSLQEKEFIKNMKKAEGGNSKYEYLVSRSYLYGEGIQLNSRKSIEWLTKAAYNKNSLAAYNLAVLFFLTQGVGNNFLDFMEIAEKLENEDAILIMKLIRLDEKNFHTENYGPITQTLKPFIYLKY